MEIESVVSEEQRQNGGHVAVEIIPSDEDLLPFINKKIVTFSSPTCIYKVPEKLVKTDEKAYVPNQLSIGPLHHGKPALSIMEENKWGYVHALLSRKPNQEAILSSCVQALKQVEDRARKHYGEEITNCNFLQIMLIDSCFLIEIFLEYPMKTLRRQNDPIFATPGMLFNLRHDMVLLENQIPFFVLQLLFEIVPIPPQCKQSLNELAFLFFKNMIPGDQEVIHKKFTRFEATHFLDLIHQCLLPSSDLQVQVEAKEKENELECASKLQYMGIKLKKRTSKSLLDIQFVNGVLEIPPLKVQQPSCTETVFKNLIAFEQCHSKATTTVHVKSYALVMASLIYSEDDVTLLARRKILSRNVLDQDMKEVLEMFKKICKRIDKDVNESYGIYGGIPEQIEEYQKSRRRALCHKVKSRYHQNPISIVVCMIAICVLGFTIVAALFSVLAYCLHHF